MTDIRNSKSFIELAKAKSNELGHNIAQKSLEHIDKITTTLQACIGNELVIATFIPMIPSLIVDEVKRRVFDKEISDLGEQLNSHRDKLNLQFIQSDEGRKIFQTLIDEILSRADGEKIHYLKKFIVSSYTQENPSDVISRHYRNILLQMDSIHLQILSVISNPQSMALDIIKKTLSENKDSFKIVSSYNQILKIDPTIFAKSIRELSGWSILSPDYQESQHQITDTPNPKKLAPTKKPAYALKHTQTYAESWWNRDHNYSSEELASLHITTQTLDRITDFGWRFIQMVKDNDKFFPTVNYSDQNTK